MSDVFSQVPEFKWHIIEDRVPFEIENTGIKITPFAGMFLLQSSSSAQIGPVLICTTR